MRKLPADAFSFYFGLGPGRSYERVAEQYGTTKRAVTKRATKERWQDHIAELEAKAREEADRRALESLDAMNERHLKSLRVVQAKAIEALKSMSLDAAIDAVRALDLAIKGERVIRGEPGERTALAVEDVIRREYDRWLGDSDGHGASG